jgi:3-methyladenine DNA glycosylase AlkD
MKAQSRSSSIRITRSNRRSVQTETRSAWTCARLLEELRAAGEHRNVEGMARYGIRAKIAYGVAKPKMDALARRIGRDHSLALELWSTGVHDARILAGMIDFPKMVSARQMDRWVRDFDNWDVCDGTCCHLFVFAAPARKKAMQWSRCRPEFMKRAGFALMAYLAYRDKQASDAPFQRMLSRIEREAWDERNFVRKSVNWALRNIGKRNLRLNREAIRAAERIRQQGSRSARWIAADALRELKSEAVQARLRRKGSGDSDGKRKR